MSNVPLPRPGPLGLIQYAGSDMQEYAAAVSAEKDAEIERLRAELAEMKSGVIRRNAVMQELEGVIAHLERRAGSMMRIEVTLDDSDVPIPIEVCGTAQMLGRLEAYNAGRMNELTRLRADIEQYVKIASELGERVKVLEDALRAMLTHMGMDEDEWNKPTFDQARTALEQKP